MHISSVIKILFCRISFSGHQNKFCACLDSIYGSRVILVMCNNGSDIRWHRLNSNQSKTNCPKNLNSDGLIVREMGPWPECIFRSLLQFLILTCWHPAHRAGLWSNFFGQPGSVSKFPPFLWVKLRVGWVGRGYTEISRYFPASWINRVTLVTKIKLLYSLRF